MLKKLVQFWNILILLEALWLFFGSHFITHTRLDWDNVVSRHVFCFPSEFEVGNDCGQRRLVQKQE